MNDAMYAHPATLHNVKTLAARGWHFIGPEAGPLAEGPSDRPGRMSEPETIMATAARLLVADRGGPWRGRRVLVTAGPTREPLDPVRYLSNRSSGRMGIALAEEGVQTLLLEGGPTLAGAFLRAGLVDKLLLFLAPALAACGFVCGANAADFHYTGANWGRDMPEPDVVAEEDGRAYVMHSSDFLSALDGSPGFARVTRSPAAITSPAPSCPMIPGASAGSPPLMADRSLWQMPDARTRTRTSPGPGSGTVIVSTVTGGFAAPGDFGAAYWARNIRAPVLFETGMRALVEAGARTFLEIDPHPILETSIRQCLEAVGCEAVVAGSLQRERGDLVSWMESVGRLHVQGHPLPFHALYPDDRLRSDLPHHPWRRRRHWLKAADGATTGAAAVDAEPAGEVDPWVGTRLRSPLPATQFQTRWSARTPRVLADHVVGGLPIVPGAAYLSAVLRAARTTGRPARALGHIAWSAPLVLGDEPVTVQLVLHPLDGGGLQRFEVFGPPTIAFSRAGAG